MMVIRVESHNMFVWIANKEIPDQTATDLGLRCLSLAF